MVPRILKDYRWSWYPGDGEATGGFNLRGRTGGIWRTWWLPDDGSSIPYMLARNNMRGMDFNEMFDPGFMLFGMGGLWCYASAGLCSHQRRLPPTSNGEALAIGGEAGMGMEASSNNFKRSWTGGWDWRQIWDMVPRLWNSRTNQWRPVEWLPGAVGQIVPFGAWL